ncbi:MAG: OmpH family outer membrane protein [Gemmatimonadales bacterium]
MRDTLMRFTRRLLVGATLVTLGAASASAQAGGAGGGAPAGQPQSGAGTLRIGFIRARTVLRQMPGYQRAESTWTKEAEAAQAEGRRLQATLDSAIAQYRQAAAMMTPSQRTAREQVLAAQRDSMTAKLQQLEERIDARERELLTPMQTKLQGVIDAIRSENNLAMVIDLDNPASANIVSFDKSLDITDRVARRATQSN